MPKDKVEAVLSWGTVRSETFFSPDECWALRRNRMHVAQPCEDGFSELICAHLSAPLPGSSMCLPLMAQRETLGLLHLVCEDAQGIPEDRDAGGRLRFRGDGLGLSNDRRRARAPPYRARVLT